MSKLAKEIMTPAPQCCSGETTLNDVANLMLEADCGEIPVTDGSNRLIGVITDRDIVCRVVAKGKNPASVTAAECMSEPVVVVNEDTSLEDVLIDFPDLVVIVAHMGHPYEELLMNYMRKWPNLYLSCTAYAPRYMDPNLVQFMNTKTYRGRVLWGSDEPWFPMRRSLAEAKELDLDDDAMAQFLGGTARHLLTRAAN